MAFGDADLFAHQIKPGYRLGHRVFDLQPGVHFDEIELTGFPQKLDRSCTAIAHVRHRTWRQTAAHALALGMA